MEVTADMASTVWQVVAAVGETVSVGRPILILESMKMEIPVLAPVDGVIGDIYVAEGDVIEAGTVLARLDRFA